MRSNLNLPDNVYLTFDDKGVNVSVSLNIPENLTKYVAPKDIFRGQVHWVYSKSEFIPKVLVTKDSLLKTHKRVLRKLMSTIRTMKAMDLNIEAAALWPHNTK